MTDTTELTTFPLEHGTPAGETIVLLHGGNVGAWMWQPQVERLPDRHLLTPDLPGYCARAGEPWRGLAGSADDIADLIRTRAVDGRAHVVGLSLGGFVATQLAWRHPELVLSITITGSALDGYSWLERTLIKPQLPLWRKRWYWAAQARFFGISKTEQEAFVDVATAPTADTNARMFAEVTAGALPPMPTPFTGPFLAASGSRETGSIRRAFGPLRAVVPQLQTWVAPGMHHPWNQQDPELFTRMVLGIADTGVWRGEPSTH
jgi:pimeloyl-ACP methyl ester carboxylesterase